jgi:DNA-binding winged helix-turn-helix (wHTH) protein/tetratricopeptide (TPR) repeat protein
VRQIQFSEFELDLELFTFRRNGDPIEIGQRPLDLLVCLIQNRERVVPLEFLRREVWNSAALSPAAIPTCVHELRRALGDNASSPRFIESVRGRGYRFIGEVRSAPRSNRTENQPFEELPFVGRKTEMKILRELLRSSVAEARGHLILIRGEAGIGKTRLLAEFLKTVPTTVPSYLARGATIEGTPAFWPWTKILREALSAQKGANQELVENAQSLSTAFPEIQGSVECAVERPTSLDRFSILSRWVQTIRSISRGTPLVLAFEDIHRADFDSLSLLAWIAEELSFDPVTVIATHRPSPETNATAQGLSEIAALPRCKNIDLTPLTAVDISLMLDPLSSDREELSEALELRTSGNAFYVTHLIRYLDSRMNTESTEALVSALPSNGREIVAHQLSDLPAPTRNALAVASVAGGAFSVPTTAEILGISNKELLELLDAARRAWLIREDGSDFAFSHALLRDALYQTIDSTHRREIHLRLAHELIKHDDSRSALISDHLTKAIPLSELTEARQFALLAGRDAATRFAYSEAQIFFRRALDLVESDSKCCLTDRCEILLEYANAQLYAGDRESARKTLLEAARLARRADSGVLLAECALQLAPDYLSIEVGSYDLTLVRMIEEALKSTPIDDFSLRSRLLARLSQAVRWQGNPEENALVTVEAVELARHSENRDALSAALSARVDSLGGPDLAEDRMQALADLYETVGESETVPAKLVHHTRVIAALLELGDIVQLDAENESCRELASQTGLAHFLWYPESTDSMRALMTGDIRQNNTLSNRYQEIQRLGQDANVTQAYALQEIYRQIEMDCSESAIPFGLEFARAQKLVLSWSAGVAWLQWDAGRMADARDSMGQFAYPRIESLFRESGGGVGIAALAEVTANLAKREHRDAYYQRISPLKNRFAAAGYGVLYFGSFARYSGLLADSLGMYPEAIRDFRQAIRAESSIGAPVWQGHSEIDLTATLQRSGASRQEVLAALSAARRTVKLTNSPRLARRFLAVADEFDSEDPNHPDSI